MRQEGVVHRLDPRILTALDQGEAVAARQDELSTPMPTKRAILIAVRGDGLGLRCMSPGDMLHLERAIRSGTGCMDRVMGGLAESGAKRATSATASAAHLSGRVPRGENPPGREGRARSLPGG